MERRRHSREPGRHSRERRGGSVESWRDSLAQPGCAVEGSACSWSDGVTPRGDGVAPESATSLRGGVASLLERRGCSWEGWRRFVAQAPAAKADWRGAQGKDEERRANNKSAKGEERRTKSKAGEERSPAWSRRLKSGPWHWKRRSGEGGVAKQPGRLCASRPAGSRRSARWRPEDIGRQITELDGYASILAGLLSGDGTPDLDFVVIDSPNQISPIMENAVLPADLFVVPFESTKAVRSYANFYKLLLRLRPDGGNEILHVLCNMTRQAGLRRRVIRSMQEEGIPIAPVEVRSCGWLAQVDEHGGSIFHYRPRSKGAKDMDSLIDFALQALSASNPPLQ